MLKLTGIEKQATGLQRDVPFSSRSVESWANPLVERALEGNGPRRWPPFAIDYDDPSRDRDEESREEWEIRDVYGLTIVRPNIAWIVAELPSGRTTIRISAKVDAADVGTESGAYYLLWRQYVGDGTWFLDGFTALRKRARASNEYRVAGTISLGIAGRISTLVGTLCYVEGQRVDLANADTRQSVRLARQEKAAEALAPGGRQFNTQFPRLDGSPLSHSGVLCVLVHGTRSCAVEMATSIPADLSSGHTSEPHISYARFEHDTHRPILENVKCLVDFVDSANVSAVAFVGHSRGGVVAAEAAERLRASNRLVRVAAFGAPFHGTPIVTAGRGAEVLLAAADSVVSQMDMLYTIARRPRRLPPGIAEMDPSGSYIRSFEGRRLPTLRQVVAGDVDLDEFTENRVITALCAGIWRGMRNAGEDHCTDLVVPVRSAQFLIGAAVASRRTAIVPGCDHFSYFKDAESLSHLRFFLEQFRMDAGDHLRQHPRRDALDGLL